MRRKASPSKHNRSAREFDLVKYLDHFRAWFERGMVRLVGSNAKRHARLIEAMKYSLEAGGKRLRPALVVMTAEAVGGSKKDVLELAAAVEFVHTYSLIHDDLPAMDDAALRRGRPTLHRAYDEATAILAGDALLTDAFKLLCDWGVKRDGKVVLGIVRELSVSAGSHGMVSGQAFDLDPAGPKDVKALDALHRQKTGAIIRASARIGGLAVGANAKELKALTDYAEKLGLAFQIVDDLLDEGGTNTGKDKGLDAKHGKKNYPAMAGRAESRKRAEKLIAGAKSALKIFGERGVPLAVLADYVLERKN